MFIKPQRASSGSFEARIRLTTRSMRSCATSKPSTMWRRARALRSSKRLRRVTTSRRCEMNRSSSSLRVSVRGWPASMASITAPKVVSIGVVANRLLSTTPAMASRLSSTTMRMPCTVALVADVADALQLLLAHQVGDLLDEPRLVHLVGNLRDDDALTVALLGGLDLRAGTDGDLPAARLVGADDALAAGDDAGGGEVRPGDELHQVPDGGLGVVDEVQRPVEHLGHVVRRDVGGHAHRDARAAVDQEVGELGGEDERLDGGVVVVGTEVDGLLVDVRQHLLGQTVHAHFRVAHGGGGIAVDRAEVALTIHEQVAKAPLLGQAHHGVVDGGVAVGVVLTNHVTHHARALLVGAVVVVAQVVHRVEDAAMHGLEAVTHVGQRAPDDDGHRVVEIRAAHLVFDVDGDELAHATRSGRNGGSCRLVGSVVGHEIWSRGRARPRGAHQGNGVT